MIQETRQELIEQARAFVFYAARHRKEGDRAGAARLLRIAGHCRRRVMRRQALDTITSGVGGQERKRAEALLLGTSL